VRRVGRFGEQGDRLRPLVQVRLEHQQPGLDGGRQERGELRFAAIKRTGE